MAGTIARVGRQRRVVRNRVALALGVSLAFAACGRSSRNIEPLPEQAGGAPADPGGVGTPCRVARDCDSDLTCTLGACRTACRTDTDCPRGSLCSGAAAPYGCSLPAELECASAEDCPAPLVCGPDNKCRVGCEVSDDCPRNDHGCRTGTCVGNDDPDPRWFECDDGETVCENTLTSTNCHEENFPESCYRRMGCRLDGMNWGLVERCSPSYCVHEIGADGPSTSWCQ
jgi:hypothetical protein